MRIVTSAALYFEPQESFSVPACWLDSMKKFFASMNASIVSVGVQADGFGDSLVLLSRMQKRLNRSIGAGAVSALELYDSDKDTTSWAVSAHVDCHVMVISLERGLMHEAGGLVKNALKFQCDLPDFVYGIGYHLQPDIYGDPYYYAVGIGGRREIPGEEYRSDAWYFEVLGRQGGSQRYLHGLFRGAYPANLLSAEHAKAAEVVGLGRLTQLSEKHWLWELSENECSAAEAELRGMNRIVLKQWASSAVPKNQKRPPSGEGSTSSSPHTGRKVDRQPATKSIQTDEDALNYLHLHPPTPSCLDALSHVYANLR